MTTMRGSSYELFTFRGWKSSGFFPSRKNLHGNTLCTSRCHGARIVSFASQKSKKKVRNDGKISKSRIPQGQNHPVNDFEDSDTEPFSGSDTKPLNGDTSETSPVTSATRSAVLQSCISTSAVLIASGSLLRQASHVASMEGWVIIDASTEVLFDFETWHIGLIIGLVILITSCRYVLLRTWRDFAESSEAANRQVLGSLQPLDYAIVAFLSGISEELLFRGALLPLFGLTWVSALVVGTFFGCLHLSGGRRYSFAIWATFVGFAYGLATVVTSSVVVPMASHSLNNLIGGILWRYTNEEKRN